MLAGGVTERPSEVPPASTTARSATSPGRARMLGAGHDADDASSLRTKTVPVVARVKAKLEAARQAAARGAWLPKTSLLRHIKRCLPFSFMHLGFLALMYLACACMGCVIHQLPGFALWPSAWLVLYYIIVLCAVQVKFGLLLL